MVIAKRTSAPRATPYALIGFSIALLVAVAAPSTFMWLPSLLSNPSREAMQTISTVVRFIFSVAKCITFILLLIAVFVGRAPQNSTQP